jgi:hypothetical protein
LPDPISKKKTFTKKGWWCDSKCRSWFQVPVLQRKERRKEGRKKKEKKEATDLTLESWILSYQLRKQRKNQIYTTESSKNKKEELVVLCNSGIKVKVDAKLQKLRKYLRNCLLTQFAKYFYPTILYHLHIATLPDAWSLIL